MSHPLEPKPAAALLQGADPEWSHCRWRLLAEGDSWFSIGSLNLFASANLLQSMAFSSFTAAVHSAFPGDTLRRMAELRSDPQFVQLLTGPQSWRWDAILLSAGGNDLIEAAGSPPSAPLERRLLRTPSEWGPPALGAARYFSEDGWRTFADYLRANLDAIVRLRDGKTGPDGSAGRPLCMHTYAYPTPRPSPAGPGFGPWLMPAMRRYAVPDADWPAVARLLVDHLADLLLACAADRQRYPALHVFDTRSIALVHALPGTTGTSGDWLNEIHLTRDGCTKLALPWCAAIERVMLANP